MERKRWSAKTEITSALLKFREKRKWQIALRRYVLDRNICVFYAPYFALDIENLRKWFEIQFEPGTSWEDFGKKWQFGHIIPVTYFDFSVESELKLCWNFTNLRIETLEVNKGRGNWPDILAAKSYFEDLYKKTLYPPYIKLLEKIEKIELAEIVSSENQQAFITKNRGYLAMIENYSALEFELLNSGRDITEIGKEIELLKKFEK
ncbi:MAG: hypothetical protein Q8941_08050 [Bacteroidota bacterium]|nr:hypothetical protein [Bacteroidota bacterium]